MNRREIGKTGRGLAGLLPLAAVILGINVAVDPAHVTGLGSYERSVAAILEEGRGAAGAANFDERLVQIDLASRLTHPAGTLVLGSSRMMALSGRSLGTSDLRNAAVASATLEDLVALYHLYTRSTGLPARVLVGVDPWTLRPNPGMQGWHSFGNAYVEACIALGQVSCSAPPFNSPLRRAVAALLSPSYFQRSIDVLLSRVGSGGRPISSLRVASEETAYPDEFVRRADGSIRYPRSYGKDQERALEAARMLGRDFTSGRIPYLPPRAVVDPTVSDRFRSLVGAIRAKGVPVVIVIPPYHPEAWPFLRSEGELFATTEAVVRQIASGLNVPVLGSFDPVRAGCGSALDFDDPSHPDESCLARIVSSTGTSN